MFDGHLRIETARSRIATYAELRQRWSEDVILRRVAAGEWRRTSRGIYLLTPERPSWTDRVVASVLATGLRDVVMWGPTAAELLGLEGATLDGPIHLASAAPAARRAVGPGVVMHQLQAYDDDVVEIGGIRLTSPLRTVVDCARTLSPYLAVVVIESGVRRRLVALDDVVAGISSIHGARGAVQARRALKRVDLRSESGLETECRLTLTDGGIPPTSLQTTVVEHDTEYRLDMAYDEHRVGVEVDGREGRAREARFVGDRRRQNAIVRRRTWLILRFTTYDIRRDRPYVVTTVREALDAAESSLDLARLQQPGA